MSELRIKNNLPLGVAWNWVKESFSIFRDKPVNFIFLAISFIVLSFFPFIGSFLGVLVLVRIYLGANKTVKGESFGLSLNLGEIFRQRNVLNYALLNMFFDLVGMVIVQEFVSYWGIDTTNQSMMMDKKVVAVLGIISLLRIVFFGISLAIITFNPEIKLFSALALNWRFMLKHFGLLILSLFLLLPFLFIPLYLGILIAFSVNNSLMFVLGTVIILLTILLFIAITTIFGYKLYADGFDNAQ